MLLDNARVRRRLKDFDFETLFIEDLGWNHYDTSISVPVDSETITMNGIAEKKGMAVFCCPPLNDGRIPDHATRLKIERQLAKSVFQHIIIYFDDGRTTQYWQWVKRETGKPMACRESQYHRNQPGDALIQKLQSIAFSIEEEETLTHVDVTNRARAAFDVEKVTKRFYDRFKTEHDAFLDFIDGIPEEGMQRWYVSVMLNRLMFIYFIQKKGFLNNDSDYLRTKLAQVKQDGKDRFYSDFLCPLFFEGFSKQESQRSAKSLQILGKIPYLNGGLFSRHQIEELHGKRIRIPDAAIERILGFFEQYHWNLDERPLRNDNEINPDVLGYIFEKYINQKQMGAYYTKEDITEYITKSTVIPFLLDSTMQKCKIAFESDKSVWRLLQNDPDRYILGALKKGVELSLPQEIAVGLDNVHKRSEWNKPAPCEYGLPMEIWREVIARRKHYESVHAKLANGEMREINDLVTYNLDIRQFAQDIIENCEGPEVLHAFYHAIERVTILDPTCGSGAFLFAALNVLEPLYEACLDRMDSLVAEDKPEKFVEFRNVLESVAKRPNRRYFILKSIILNNLFGVDIMEEAIEICKLRLFLKLVAQVDRVEQIEPLPDIDFNIRAGNTLVGFATQKDVENSITISKDGSKRLFWSEEDEDKIRLIKGNAEKTSLAFYNFCHIQTNDGHYNEFEGAKHELKMGLNMLERELNHYLAREYGIDVTRKDDFKIWLNTHKPFHWFIEFYEIIKNGGFDIIIGNPPYVEYKDIKNTYKLYRFKTILCNDLYAFTVERAYNLLRDNGRVGMIVPLSIFGTDGFASLQRLSLDTLESMWISCFSNRPSQLFEGAQKRLTILLGRKGHVTKIKIYTTAYIRWMKEERESVFDSRIKYCIRNSFFNVFPASLEKLGEALEVSAFSKILSSNEKLGYSLASQTNHAIYYTRKFGYFLAFLDFVPRIVNIKSGQKILPSELKKLNFGSSSSSKTAIAGLSSSTFFWFWNVVSDCRNLNRRDLLAFPLNPESISSDIKERLVDLGEKYVTSLRDTTRMMLKSGLQIETFNYASCKQILDEIDSVLKQHYGFSEEEIDFIINYDIKYRMRLGSEEVEEE